MSLTSKSPRKVILVALAVGKEAFADYSHPCSPKVFTQPQLFACRVLMTFLDTDYRGVEAHLRDLPAYALWLGLKRIPDHSTLQKAGKRLFGTHTTDRLLAASVRLMMGRRKLVRRAAADSSGLESGHRSPYFVRRRARGQKGLENPRYQTTTYTRFPKLTVLVDPQTHQVLALLTGRGPRPDLNELDPLLARRPRGITLLALLADAGYDSEANHVLLREEHGIRSLIPARHGRPPKGGQPPSGHYRRLMKHRLRTKRRRRRCGYTQRAQIETVFSMIKRNLTDTLLSRSYHAQNREMRLLVLTHNLMILLCWRGFSTEPIRAIRGNH
jgi:Transposase DDE domain